MPHKTELDRLALGLMLLFCTIWGTQQVVIKLVSEGISPVWQAGLRSLGVSAIVLPLLSLVLGEPGVFAPSVLIWAGLLFQIIVVAAISYMGWFWLIARYPVTRLSTFSFLTPVMGVLAGGLLLDEALTPAVFVALALVALGIWVANRPARR